MKLALSYHVAATSNEYTVNDYIDDNDIMHVDCSNSGTAQLYNENTDDVFYLRVGLQQIKMDEWRGHRFTIRQIGGNESTVHLYSKDGQQ